MERRTALRRRLRRFPLLAWPIAFAFALLLWGQAASADYGLTAQPIRAASHKHDVGAYWISKADCQSKDDSISFTFNATPSGPLFQIWVSESTTCAAYTERSGTAPVCTQIVKDPSSITSTPFTVKLKTSEIARALKNVDEDCNDTSGVTGGRVVKVNFLFMANGEDSAPIVVTNGGSLTMDLQVDLVGPPAPGDLEVTSSEGALAVKLVDPPQATTGVAGYNLYCDPPPDSQAGSDSGCACANIGATTDAGAGASAGSGGSASKVLPPIGGSAGSAGAGGDVNPPPPGTGASGTGASGTGASGTGASGTGASGTGAGGAGGTAGAGGSTCVDVEITEKTCQSCVLEDATKEGAALPGATYLCGTIPSNGTEGRASILSNDLTYAVAVAAFDKLGNEGPLSTARCATPKAVSDFFEDYRAAGGKGGGGCSVQPWMRTKSAIAPLAAALASLALVLRRRRRARAARRGESS